MASRYQNYETFSPVVNYEDGKISHLSMFSRSSAYTLKKKKIAAVEFLNKTRSDFLRNKTIACAMCICVIHTSITDEQEEERGGERLSGIVLEHIRRGCKQADNKKI